MVKRIFLSYSSQDAIFKKNFTGKDVFESILGEGIVLKDYENEGNFGSIGEYITRNIKDSAAIILFISRFYIERTFTKFEFWKGLDGAARRRLVFVPVMLDADAKEWWRKQKDLGALNDLTPDGGEYGYVDFSGGEGPIAIYENGQYNDKPAQKIRDLAIYIRKELEEMAAEGPPPLPPQPATAPIVLLGHPEDTSSAELRGLSDELTHFLQGHGKTPSVWRDGWSRPENTAAREKADEILRQNDAVFVQPVTSYEANLLAKWPDALRDSLKEVAAATLKQAPKTFPCPIVLWLPSRLSEKRLDLAKTDFPTRLSRATPEALADELIGGKAKPPQVPVIMLEEFTTNPDLRTALHEGFQRVVEKEVTPPPMQFGFELERVVLVAGEADQVDQGRPGDNRDP